jgi:hypothetical protein
MDVVGSPVRHQGTSLQLSGPGNQSRRKAITEKDDKSSGVAWMSPLFLFFRPTQMGLEPA